ncbi:APC family permease [Barrientosiimonas endolithica]|uniref:Conserved hypothetical transport protein n=1 Tax=Barrientosiimonas endolithica TaxID=1535208 RepID=A0ABM8H8F4_9MICO|nr:APC family permease [Barrientosiimonas endolithica]BDZ57146.1 conserved hypothetical transport protein [Barrientosiimonas endolithica]
MTAAPQPELARRLTTTDAVVVGLSAMIGAGVFVVFAPAAAEAGSWLFAALALAALVALCNATSTAQLAIAFPTSGGAYVFGRRMLGPTLGFLAGWGFVVGKTASCAAMALTFASYAVPAGGWWARLVAVAAVVALTVANLRGVTRTARVASVLLVMSLVTLVLVLVVGWAGLAGGRPAVTPLPSGDLRGVLMAAGLLFFAFAGYARIATLAEEVRRPEMIGRAVLVALTTAIVLYVAVGATLVALLGDRLPRVSAPVAEAVAAAGAGWATPVVRVGAAAAALGALLALLAGVSRTALAMARERDLPGWFAAVDEQHRVPHHAQLVIGAVLVVLVLTTDLRGVIGFSSFGVLVYYSVANASAWRQPAEERRWPRAVQVVGLLGCLVLAFSLPLTSVLAGCAVLALGVLGRSLLRR